MNSQLDAEDLAVQSVPPAPRGPLPRITTREFLRRPARGWLDYTSPPAPPLEEPPGQDRL